jgi:hypothetical protein
MRWEYSNFTQRGSFDQKKSLWTGPDGERHEIPGLPMVTLTKLGYEGWEVVSTEFRVIDRDDYMYYYLLKRPLGN